MKLRAFAFFLLTPLLGCKSESPQALPAYSAAPTAPMVTTLTTPDGSTATPTAVATDQDRAAALRGDPAFASRLYAQLRGRQGNLFFSPTSIRMALAMTYAGARGETAAEMAKVLAFDGDAQSLHRGFAGWLSDLEGANTPLPGPDAPAWQKAEAERKRQTIRVVNRLWGQQGRAFQPDFLALLQADYAAPLERVDFLHATENARTTINDFVDRATEHKIRDLIPQGTLTSDERLVLTNAVYFKAAWAEPFLAQSTADGSFTVSPSKSVTARLMTQTQRFAYAKVPDAKVLEIPYASGRMSMVIVLPDDEAGLSKVEQSMTDQAIPSYVRDLQPTRVHVTLPRFTMTSHFMLSQPLSQMGMSAAFDSKVADFSGMDGTRELFIGQVLHEAFVAVDEKGTEAAAATAVLMKAGAAMRVEDPVEFRADHPFLFFLRDTGTGAVLFMGRVVDPTAGSPPREGLHHVGRLHRRSSP